MASLDTVPFSGSTLQAVSYFPGLLNPDLGAEDARGAALAYTPLFFWVRDCGGDLPITTISVPPFDLEKVFPDDDDYIRYLPQWMAVHGTQTSPASASLLFQMIS